jgi:hypothetical protein
VFSKKVGFILTGIQSAMLKFDRFIFSFSSRSSFVISYFLLVSSIGVFGQVLKCRYGNHTLPLWPAHNYCELSLVDLSEKYKNSHFSFTGTPEQKSAATTVFFNRPSNVDFLPKEILNDFPQFNSLNIHYCDTLTIIKNDLFTKDFNVIQYLHLSFNKIESIEANAFQLLTNLKWIALGDNQMQSLPHQIFRNNPEIIIMWLDGNKITSITPDFFKNLNKLQFVSLLKNQCIYGIFGCASGSCLVTQSELDNNLSTCYSNFLNTVDGKPKMESLECGANLQRAISELKSLEQEVARWTLSKQSDAECNREKEVIDRELRALKQENTDLKIKLLDSDDRHLDCRVED